MKSPKEGFEKSQELAKGFEETNPVKNGSINTLDLARFIGFSIKIFKNEDEPGLIGIASFIDTQNKEISINQTLSLSEMMFATGIEIGQFLIYPKYTVSSKYKPIEIDELFKPKSNIETKIAHDLASRLLIPNWSVETAEKASLTLDCASLMNVPEELIITRIEQFEKIKSILH